jgi:endonuclease YncB( thermonuclease family)
MILFKQTIEIIMFNKLILSAAIFGALASQVTYADSNPAGDIRAAVEYVVDGDTFVIEQSGIPMTIDLEGVNAPDMQQPYGPEAKHHLENLILSKALVINVQRDVAYQHITAQVLIDGVDINAVMVHDGYAWADEGYTYSTNLVETQKIARKQKIGLWQQKSPKNPIDFKMGPQRVYKQPVITVAYPDAPHDESDGGSPKDTHNKPGSLNIPPPPAPHMTPPMPKEENKQGGTILNHEQIQQAKQQNTPIKK